MCIASKVYWHHLHHIAVTTCQSLACLHLNRTINSHLLFFSLFFCRPNVIDKFFIWNASIWLHCLRPLYFFQFTGCHSHGSYDSVLINASRHVNKVGQWSVVVDETKKKRRLNKSNNNKWIPGLPCRSSCCPALDANTGDWKIYRGWQVTATCTNSTYTFFIYYNNIASPHTMIYVLFCIVDASGSIQLSLVWHTCYTAPVTITSRIAKLIHLGKEKSDSLFLRRYIRADSIVFRYPLL